VVTKLYTGQRVVQAFGIGHQLLMKLQLQDGKVIKAFTNGVDMEGDPASVKYDINLIADCVLRYDKSDANRHYYYWPDKTKIEMKKEWDDVK
jgi:hypothetical protein